MSLSKFQVGVLCVMTAIATTIQAEGLSDASDASAAGISQAATGAVSAVSAIAAMPLSAVEAIGTASGLLAEPLIASAQRARPLPVTEENYTAGPAPDQMLKNTEDRR